MTNETSISSGKLIFFRDREALLPLFSQVRRLILRAFFGHYCMMQKARIFFRLQRPFAWVWLPSRQGIKDRPAQYLILSFASENEVLSPIIDQCVFSRPGLYTKHAILTGSGQMDEELAGLLRSSLMLRNRKNRLK